MTVSKIIELWDKMSRSATGERRIATATTGLEQRRDADVLCHQIRQSFRPGEITPEEANRVGYETAMRWTNGRHAFFVATHTDKAHIHNHIYYNPTTLDCTRKYRDFFRSASALRRLSDRVCLENDLSVIVNPRLHSRGRFLHYGQWIGERSPSAQQRLRVAIGEALAKKPADFEAFLRLMDGAGYAVKCGRGGVISFLVPGQDKPTRLRASTLGEGYDPADIRAVIAGERPAPALKYERWVKVYNLKQMPAALQYLREHGLGDYATLEAATNGAVDRFHALAGELRETEAALAKSTELMAAVVDYAKTRPAFEGYKAARYSKKYLAEHESELATCRAAKAAMNDVLAGAGSPGWMPSKSPAGSWPKRKRPFTGNTARPSGKCGRPWPSRPTSTICSA